MPSIIAQGLTKQYLLGGRRLGRENFREMLGRCFSAPFRRVTGKGDRSPGGEEFLALDTVSFEVKRGEAVGVIGKNGAGKSTLLKILSRITQPTSGRAEIRGRVGSLLEVGTGFHPELTGRENVYLNGAILGMTRSEIRKKFDEIVAFSEVERFLDTPVKRYSSGMYVRLAFAVAAHLEPEILIVDEVLAVGDAQFQKKCLGKMGDVTREGRTVLFVSHNMPAVQNLCRRALFLCEGRLAAEGDTGTVIDRYLAESAVLARIPLAERTDRKGSGALRFTLAALRGDAGEEVGAFQSGRTARLVLDFENRSGRVLQNLHFSVGIDSRVGERIALLSSEVRNEGIPRVQDRSGSVEILVERLPLAAGRYGFTLYSTESGAVADWIQGAGSFDVVAGDYYGTGRTPPQGQGSLLLDYRVRYLRGAGSPTDRAAPGVRTPG